MPEFTFLNHWVWLGFAACLVICEVLLGTSFFLLWLGGCACAVGIVVWIFPLLSWQSQLTIFVVSALISMIFWKRYLKSHHTKTENPTLNRRAEQYIGRTFTLKEAIVNGRGIIQVDDSTWRVEGEDLPLGTLVKVTGVDGVILKVKALN